MKAARIVPLERAPRIGWTLTEAVNRWQAFKAHSWTEKVRRDIQILAGRWSEDLGSKILQELTPLDVEALYLRRVKDGLAGSTLNKERAYLHGFLRWAMERRLISRDQDPSRAWPSAKEIPIRKRLAVSKEDEAKLLHGLPELSRRVVVFSVLVGLRISEIWALTWSMASDDPLNPGEWLLTVPAELRKQRRAYTVPIPRKAREVLGPQGKPEEKLFQGLPTQEWFRVLLRRAAIAAGLDPAISPHAFRRTWCTRLLDAGVPDAAVQKLGGWASMPVMVKHYHVLRDEKAREYLERI